MDENFKSSEHFMRFAYLWLSNYNEKNEWTYENDFWNRKEF